MNNHLKQNPETGQVNGVLQSTITANNSTILELSRTTKGNASNLKVEPFRISLSDFADMVKAENIKVGEKDGTYFVRGSCKGERRNDAMGQAENLLIVIDGDKSINDEGEIIEGAPDPTLAHRAMKQAGIEHVIYTSHSHHEQGQDYYRWRLLVPSDATPQNLTCGVDAILDILHIAEVKVAPVNENNVLSLAWYFPRVDAGRADGYYSASYETGDTFKVPVALSEPIQASIQAKPKHNGESVIQAYCDEFPLKQKIKEMGFKHIRENRYLPPDSKSGVAGAKILIGDRDGRERLFIHNTSHRLNGKGLDAFDVFCEEEHQGDFKIAVRAAAELLGLSATNDAFAMFIAAEAQVEAPDQDPLPVDVLGISIENPPGLAGHICQYLNKTANRPIPLIYPIVALQMLSLLAGKRKGVGDIKLNLLTLAIAPSAAGKEHGQGWFAETATKLKLGRHVAGGISSDVDMIRNLVDGEGLCCYRIDEIQGLFNAINSTKANTYESKIGDLILTLATSKTYLFAGNHRRQFLSELDKQMDNLENQKAKAEKAPKTLEKEETETENKRDPESLDRALCRLAKKRGFIEEGWPNPIVSIMGHSTPSGLDSLITEENIGSGLIGRCLVLRCAEEREKLQEKKELPTFDKFNLDNGLKYLLDWSDSEPLKVNTEARKMLNAIQAYYDEDSRLNAPVMGAIYARVMEQVNKVVSLLALEVGEVQPEHVRYAFALVSRCIDDIAYLLKKDTAQKVNAGIDDIALHTREEIKRRLASKEAKVDGLAPSTLKQAVLKCNANLKKLVDNHNKNGKGEDKPNLYEQIVDHMVEVGDLELKKHGKKTRYILKEGG